MRLLFQNIIPSTKSFHFSNYYIRCFSSSILLSHSCCSSAGHYFIPFGISSSLCSSSSFTLRHHRRCSSSSSSPTVQPSRSTCLYDYQRSQMKARMVDFGGWMLPVSFPPLSLIDSHIHTRTNCSLFDVSHMAQVRLSGADRVSFLESLVVAELQDMPVGNSKLTLFTNSTGGIIDDAIVSVQDGYLQLVLNAGCRDKDIKHIQNQIAQKPHMDVQLSILSDMSLLALQGPKSMDVLSPLIPDVDLHKMPFMTSVVCSGLLGGIEGCTVSRCGYTGEDGFEISVPNESVVALYKLLLAETVVVMPAGLGARDTLRLEAGLCLYGHDMDESKSPVQAGLTWTIGKRRRAEMNFPGADVIVKQIADGVDVKRVGLICESKAVAREDSIVYSGSDVIGRVTSGTFSPTLQKPIAMAYVTTANAKVDTVVEVDVRNKRYKAKVTKMPFVKACYYKP
eukprot:GHVS01037096.1.p1 GENE.GHVS01037096.1~~GHVS01037096.1.p1  ORF type:complete len:452 (+),score=62.42 GHVS01037096.1:95-1450(+)